jgi:predicted aminopeptidase
VIRRFLRLVVALALLLLSGCSSLSYYTQAVHGQLEISSEATPIGQVLADPATDPKVRQRLQLVREARAFATTELGLPDNGTFQSYANLHRPYVVWNVFAAPAFSVTPVHWCFPIAGCVAYRGYFSEAAAQEAGAALRAEGLDVFVAGIPIYSTLGWFNDPVLNTFIGYPDPELVGVIFHELAHQVVYLPGDSVFNESFATAVEDEGVRRWLEHVGSPASYAQYEKAQARKRAFTELLVHTRDRLAAVYEQPGTEERSSGKARVLKEAQTQYADLKRSWGGYTGYDKWFMDTPLNNAKLAAVMLYADRLPAFRGLLAEVSGDLPRFYAEVRALTRLSPTEREARLVAAEEYKLAAKPAGRPGAPSE